MATGCNLHLLKGLMYPDRNVCTIISSVLSANSINSPAFSCEKDY